MCCASHKCVHHEFSLPQHRLAICLPSQENSRHKSGSSHILLGTCLASHKPCPSLVCSSQKERKQKTKNSKIIYLLVYNFQRSLCSNVIWKFLQWISMINTSNSKVATSLFVNTSLTNEISFITNQLNAYMCVVAKQKAPSQCVLSEVGT